jgi:uncharacterized protein YyaL (SSP411 family)
MTANRLAGARSPYLLQHARNPVDWHPWEDAVFARARAEDKPVFVSVGYSACHWCHVMERESFEDPALAAYLNAHFLSVKVDREERPDVDATYQLAHQAMTGRPGGWPLSVFVTPDRRPFFAGTYFPPAPRHGLPSFREVLEAIVEAWTTRRADLDAQADALTTALARVAESPAGVGDAPTKAALSEALAEALPRVDTLHGGFGRRPKFPNTMTLDLLVLGAALDLDGHGATARRAVGHTLRQMARGGIWDHLGGGFARYSTDAAWHVPHFEKMLYDNAQLLRLYLDAARLRALRGDPDALLDDVTAHAVVRETAAWLAREMTAPDGSLYAAQDADSEGEEGRYFVWTPDEIARAAPDEAAALCAWFDVRPEGNWEHGRNVLWTPKPLAEVAQGLGQAPEVVREAIVRGRTKLLATRARRARPATDTKSLAAWNGLCLGALADAGSTLGDAALTAMATRGLDAWRTRAWDGARLAHAMVDGEAYGVGFLDDYGATACAAVDVFEATGDGGALGFARGLLDAVRARFLDPADGSLAFTPDDAEVVLHRTRDGGDHATPGGVGLCLDAMLRVATLTGDPALAADAHRVAARYNARTKGQAFVAPALLRALDRAARGPVEVIVLGDPARDDTQRLLRAARSVYVPHRVLVRAPDADAAVLAGVDAALVAYRTAGPDGAPVAYVCRGTSCEMPARSDEALVETLRRVADAMAA